MSTIVQFGQYLLLKKIATGGMAELFLGKQIGPARKCARNEMAAFSDSVPVRRSAEPSSSGSTCCSRRSPPAGWRSSFSASRSGLRASAREMRWLPFLTPVGCADEHHRPVRAVLAAQEDRHRRHGGALSRQADRACAQVRAK